MSREMLIIINGTVGVGKTTTSNSLATAIPNAVAIEGDMLAFTLPDRHEDSYQNDHGLKVGIQSISDHRNNGAKIFIFDRIFENQKKLDWFISQVGLESHVFYLSANEAQLSDRIRKRASRKAEADILDSKRVQLNQDQMKNRGIPIETNGKHPHEITMEIKKYILTDRA